LINRKREELMGSTYWEENDPEAVYGNNVEAFMSMSMVVGWFGLMRESI
jgi:hypothetical protein